MGWQAGDDSGPGEAPGPGGSLPELLAGFEHGGAWDRAAPSAELAAVLEAVAGPDGLYEGAGPGAMVGIARQWLALGSHASAGLMGALRSMMRENGDGQPLLRRELGMPDGWDDSLNYELAAALAMGPVSAANLAGLAHALGARLPQIGRLLAGGVLTQAKAKLIVGIFEPLDEDEAARAEALILGQLKGKTWFQVERLAWRAAVAVAPDVAERRRRKAERRARVTVFREEAGTVGLSGRDLPAARALAAHASVIARAKEYRDCGAFGDQTQSALDALAYTDLLNGVSAQDAIAFARAAGTEPPGTSSQDDDPDDGEDPFGPADSGQDDDPGPGGPDDDDDPQGGPQPRGPGGTGQRADAPGNPGNRDGDDDADTPDGDDRDNGDASGGGGHDGDPDDGDPDEGDPDSGPGPDGGTGGPGGAGGHRELPEVTVPLATLLGLARRAGESRLLGAFDPALTRELALAAARSPHSRWEVTIVDENGYAIGHGLARPGRGRRQGPQPPGPPGCALPARVNITVTETLLRQLAAQPRPGAPPGNWAFAPKQRRAADTGAGDHQRWALTLPGGLELAVRFDVVPTHSCDHKYQVNSYEPGDRLRRLVQIRDHECTFPPCSRPAHQSDFEHAVPFDKGGRTDACNAGARSRRCHQVKQSPGWKVTQPKPGWHLWTTPTSRTYVQEPWRYIA